MNNEQLRSVSLVLLVIFAALYFYTWRQQQFYDPSARPAIEQILRDISQWQKQPLLDHLSDEARQTLSDEQLEKLLIHYRRFGALKSIGDLEFSKLASALSLFGAKRINYQGTATFSGGPADINITLVPSGNGYLIYNLAISVPR